MLIACWSVKGGSGTTVVATVLALLHARAGGALVADLVGDVPAALGIPEPPGPGLAAWLAAADDVGADALDRLAVAVAPGLDLHAVLRALSERGITRLLVEGGSRIASSFVAAGLVDEFWLLRGPDALSTDAVAALDAMPLSTLTQSPAFRARASETLDKDTLTIYDRG